MLSWLEKRLRRFAIPRLTLILIFGQVLVYMLSYRNPAALQMFVLVPRKVLQGEWWRLIAFLFLPPCTKLIFAFFAYYLFYLFGSALEAHWGDFRYNVYIFVAYVATVASVFLVPNGAATNAYIGGSIFLAFAYLYPDFTLHIFFVLPVKVKYMAWITWFVYGMKLAGGSWMVRLHVLAAVGNFLLFFGRDIWLRAKSGKRRMEGEVRRIREKNKPFHCCAVCGKTERSDPATDFRVCPECHGAPDYCEEHIHDHQHIQPPINEEEDSNEE